MTSPLGITIPTPLHTDESVYANSIFGFIDKKMDELKAILSDSVDITTQEYKFPEIIIIGDESNGKSSLLENITKCHIFPKDRAFCTKRPIRFISKHDTCRKFTICDTTSNKPGLEFTSDVDVYHYLSDMFAKMGAADLSENEIVIEYASPDNHNFQFVDLPGVKASPLDLSEQTKKITSKYLAEKNNIVMLAYSAMTRTSATCSTFSLVHAHNRQKDTIMVLTMMDKLSDSEDVIHAKDSVVGAMEKTFYVISNSKSTLDEVSWFKEHNITENVGVNTLLAYTEELFMKYVNENWHKNIIRKLESQKDALRKEKESFGTTEADDLEFYKYFLNAIYDKTVGTPETLFEKSLVEYFPTKTTKHTATSAEIKNGRPVVSTKTWDVVEIDPGCKNEEILEQICTDIVNKAMKLITEHSKALLMDDYNPHFDSSRNSCKCSSDSTNKSVTCKALQYAGISCHDSHSQGSNRTIYRMDQIKNFSESLDRYLISVRNHIETVLESIRNDLKTRIQFGFLKTYLDPNQNTQTTECKMIQTGFLQFFINQFTGFSYDFSSNTVLIENEAIIGKRRDFMGNISAVDSKIEKIQQRK